MADNRQRLAEVFREVFEDESIELKDELVMADIDNWDSVSHFQMIMEVELEFGIKLTTAEIAGFKNVGELLKIIGRHQEITV